MAKDEPVASETAAGPAKQPAGQDESTSQGFQAAGPGNRHGVPPDDSPGQGGLGERPFSPEGGQPAADPEAAARQLLDKARQGPPAEGDAGPLGAESEAKRGDG